MKIETARKFARSLEGAIEAPHHDHASFRIRGRIFVTVPPTEDVIHVFVGEEDRELALAMYPDWAGKLLWGGKVCGLRITLAAAAAAPVKRLIAKAHEAQASKR